MEEPQLKLPLSEFVKNVAREAALAALDEHYRSCPVAKDIVRVTDCQEKINSRMGKLEIRVATIVGLIFGAAGIGGVSGAGMAKLLGG